MTKKKQAPMGVLKKKVFMIDEGDRGKPPKKTEPPKRGRKGRVG